MKIMVEDGAYRPVRIHDNDAGLDLCAKHGGIIPAHGSAAFETGVHIQLPHGTVGFVKSRSGLMFKHGITTDGTIDEGFTGQIGVNLFNHSDVDYDVKAGDRIAQLVIVEVMYPHVAYVDALDDSERGESGFGSTGR